MVCKTLSDFVDYYSYKAYTPRSNTRNRSITRSLKILPIIRGVCLTVIHAS